jgi:hypothetical protein
VGNGTLSAMEAVRELRDQVLARLEENEDWRTLRGLEFVMSKEREHLNARKHSERPQAQQGVRGLQSEIAAKIVTPFTASTKIDVDDDTALDFSSSKAG